MRVSVRKKEVEVTKDLRMMSGSLKKLSSMTAPATFLGEENIDDIDEVKTIRFGRALAHASSTFRVPLTAGSTSSAYIQFPNNQPSQKSRQQ